MLRRRSKAPPEPAQPEPAWRSRVDEARAMIRSNQPPEWIDSRLDEIERALLAAEDDRMRLAAAIDRLDPERSTRELKDALRADHRRPGSVASARLDMLRKRHDTVNELLNRREALGQRVDTAVIDLELLAVRSVDAFADGRPHGTLDDELDTLRADLVALEQAHAELDDI